MEACIKNFEEIFILSEKRFEVPFFQRKYVWGEDNWKRCLDDFRKIAEGDTPHFMGSLLFMKDNNDKATILIDGLQRLTTLSLLYYAFYDSKHKFPFQWRNKIAHYGIDHLVFSWIVDTNCERGKEPPFFEENLIYKCFNYFKKELRHNPQLLPSHVGEVEFLSIELSHKDDTAVISETIKSLERYLNKESQPSPESHSGNEVQASSQIALSSQPGLSSNDNSQEKTPQPGTTEVKVLCPFCEQKLIIDSIYNGQEFSCPQCSNIFRFKINEE